MAKAKYNLRLIGDDGRDPAFRVIYESLRRYGVKFMTVPCNCCPTLSVDGYNQYGSEAILECLVKAGEINKKQREEIEKRISRAGEEYRMALEREGMAVHERALQSAWDSMGW